MSPPKVSCLAKTELILKLCEKASSSKLNLSKIELINQGKQSDHNSKSK